MSWEDCVFEDWADCEWADWDDCEWDKFEVQDRTAGHRTVRLLPPISTGNLKRPYLEGNPSYVEDSRRYPDAAYSEALIRAKGQTKSNMVFKQPYRSDSLLKMKYRDESPLPYNDSLSAFGTVQTPQEIMEEGKTEEERQYVDVWIPRLNDYWWDSYHKYVYSLPNFCKWFDNRWVGHNVGVTTTYDPAVILAGKGIFTVGEQWYRGFYPRKLRVECRDVTGLGYPIYLALYDEDVQTIALSTNYTSGEELTINFNGKVPFGALALWLERGVNTDEGEFEVTNVEFQVHVEVSEAARLQRGRITQQATLRRAFGWDLIHGYHTKFPKPVKIFQSVRLPRQTNLRPVRGK